MEISSRYEFGPAKLEDDLGTFVVERYWQGALGVLLGEPWEYRKTYLTGSHLFNRKLSGSEYSKFVGEIEKKYGYLDWKADYIPGEVPLEKPVM